MYCSAFRQMILLVTSSSSFFTKNSIRHWCPQPDQEKSIPKNTVKDEWTQQGPGLTRYSLYEPGDKFSTDWDKAWSSFKKQGKKSFSSQFSPNKYVTWNPRRSNYPLSEEVDPIKRTERSNLMLWTSPRFTLGLAIVIVSLLLIYTILAPPK
uniref:Uncharacterized protein n=1 Tax=Chenopodium quinoa TaxID=63459 RepID=A0A803KUJ9_CHEQI